MTRVLHVVGGLRVGGKERVALELCRAGREAGHDDRIAVFEHPLRGGDGELDPGDVPVHAEAVAEGTIGRVRALARLVRRLGPAVVHAHNDSAVVLGAAASLLPGAGAPRRITTFHNMPVQPRARDRVRVRAAAARQHAVACVSGALRDERIRGGWVRDAEVVPNGVDLARFAPDGPRMDLGLGTADLVVGMVARFDSGKRQADLAAACAALREGGLDVALALVGDGPLRSAGPGGHTPAFTRASVPDVAAFLRAVDVVALASDHEGMPMSILEAMAAGRAVVASDVGGVPELVAPGCGVLVPPRDVDALAAAIARCRDDRRRAALGGAARARVEARFSLRRAADAYDALHAVPE